MNWQVSEKLHFSILYINNFYQWIYRVWTLYYTVLLNKNGIHVQKSYILINLVRYQTFNPTPPLPSQPSNPTQTSNTKALWFKQSERVNRYRKRLLFLGSLISRFAELLPFVMLLISRKIELPPVNNYRWMKLTLFTCYSYKYSVKRCQY